MMIHDLITLTRLNLHTQRGRILAWCLPLWALVAVFPPAYRSYYPTLESRQVMIEGLRNNTGTTAIYGVISEPGTIGQMTTWEIGAWVGLLGSVMSVLLVAATHRRAEGTGLAELQRSTGIHPSVPAVSALLTTVTAATLLGAGTSAVLLIEHLVIDELTVAGAFSFGATVALMATGSALLAQIVMLLINDAAALTRAALLTLAASFILRVLADTRETAWLNWLSPLGWREIIGPYDTDDWVVIALLTVVCALLAVGIALADRRRSHGAGLLPRRRQAGRRTRRVRGPLSLRWLLSRGGLTAWVLIVAGVSALLMSLSGTIADLVGLDDGTGQIFRDLFDGDAAYEQFIAYISQVVGILIAAGGIQQITSHHGEEKARTVDLQRATGVRRWVPLGATTLVALLSVVAMTLALLLGGAAGLATQDSTVSGDYDSLLHAALSQLGPTLLLTGIAVLVVGLVPRLSTVAWAPLAAAAVISLMGAILQLPDWVIDTSPFSHTQLPDSAQPWIPGVMVAGGLLATVIGLLGTQRREVS